MCVRLLGYHERREQDCAEGESGLCRRCNSHLSQSSGELWGWVIQPQMRGWVIQPQMRGWVRQGARPWSPPSVTHWAHTVTLGQPCASSPPPLGRCCRSPSRLKVWHLAPSAWNGPFLHTDELQLILQVHRPFPLALKSVWNRTKYRTVDAYFFTKKREKQKYIYRYICIYVYTHTVLCIHNINISLERYIRNCKQWVLTR